MTLPESYKYDELIFLSSFIFPLFFVIHVAISKVSKIELISSILNLYRTFLLYTFIYQYSVLSYKFWINIFIAIICLRIHIYKYSITHYLWAKANLSRSFSYFSWLSEALLELLLGEPGVLKEFLLSLKLASCLDVSEP